MQRNMNQQKNNPQQQESGVHKLFRDVINLAFYFFCATTVFMVMAYSDFTVEPQMTASRTDQTVDVSIEVKDKISDGYIISDFDCDTFTPTASKYGVREPGTLEMGYPLMTEENVAKLASMTIEHYKKKAMLVSLMSGAIAIALFTLRKKIKKS